MYGNRWIFCLAPGSFRWNDYLTKRFFFHTHRIDQFKLTNWSIYGCRLLIGSLIFCVFFSLIKFDLMSLLFLTQILLLLFDNLYRTKTKQKSWFSNVKEEDLRVIHKNGWLNEWLVAFGSSKKVSFSKMMLI